ncbi:helix-turn-helix transcriptional regulator [Pontimicrobium sp. SW4]|uniref:Helix-turn-helix transcriptional regulator n=1 Tax=Pontimicrobium sp. SW4 TaxID=3153519 RepID=A0AAU7BV11_9FLAO
MEFKHLAKGYKLIECENLEIAASCEAHFDEGECTESEFYHPSNVLVYVEQGSLEIELDNKRYLFTKGQICLVRKYTHVKLSKRFAKEEKQAKTYAFMMRDKFLRNVITNFKFKKDLQPIGERILELAPTKNLLDIIASIKYAVDNKQYLNTVELETNLVKSLKAIINSNPKLAILFKEFTLAKRVDLKLFMDLSFMPKKTLKELAELSGRSLSTFEREFKLIFDTTPHQWILKKRLQLAHDLLLSTNKYVSDICIECGFEDLGHFSKVFKNEFGLNPSEIKNNSSIEII